MWQIACLFLGIAQVVTASSFQKGETFDIQATYYCNMTVVEKEDDMDIMVDSCNNNACSYQKWWTNQDDCRNEGDCYYLPDNVDGILAVGEGGHYPTQLWDGSRACGRCFTLTSNYTGKPISSNVQVTDLCGACTSPNLWEGGHFDLDIDVYLKICGDEGYAGGHCPIEIEELVCEYTKPISYHAQGTQSEDDCVNVDWGVSQIVPKHVLGCGLDKLEISKGDLDDLELLWYSMVPINNQYAVPSVVKPIDKNVHIRATSTCFNNTEVVYSESVFGKVDENAQICGSTGKDFHTKNQFSFLEHRASAHGKVMNRGKHSGKQGGKHNNQGLYTNESFGKSSGKQTGKHTGKSTGKSTGKHSGKNTGKSAEKHSGKNTGKSAGKHAGKKTGKSSGKHSPKFVQKQGHMHPGGHKNKKNGHHRN